MTAMNAPHFHDDDTARAYLESVRWPDGPVCPHCGSKGGWAIQTKPVTRKNGRVTPARQGLYKCTDKDCEEQFSVTVGTVFERSHIPLSKWLLAAYLLCSSKKGMSSHQLHRTLDVTYKTAWFLTHRIRHAMANLGTGLLGSGGGVVEADETYIGKQPRKAGQRAPRGGWGHKYTEFALVGRGGNVRSTHMTGKIFDGVKAQLAANVSPDANLMTDDARMYRKVAKQFASHSAVNHSRGEYVRGDAHTNTIEGVFSVFKRGMIGTDQHCGSQQLQRDLAEFDFRYNHRSSLGVEDNHRMVAALKGIEGKRLTYRRVD